MVGLTEGLGFEEVNQSVTNTEIISGTNVYASVELQTPLVTATYVDATQCAGTLMSEVGKGYLHSTSIGSATAVYGASIQAGSGALSAGSNDWIVYPSAFTALPSVVVTDRTTADMALLVGSISVGSSYIEGPTASDAYSWIAVGI